MTELTIQNIRARAVMAPLARPIQTAATTIPKAPLVLVDVETKEGVVGRSYLFAYTPVAQPPLASLVERIGETMIGQTAAPAARYDDHVGRFRLLGRQGLVGMAIAGLDMALWDAAAKARDLSVANMLGAGVKPIPCYDSHGVFSVDRDHGALANSLAQGFRAVKFKIGGENVSDDLATIREIQQIIGPGTRLMVDYNQSLTTPEALRRLHVFDREADLTWVEEPLPTEDFAGYRTLRQSVKTPLQAGENWLLPEDAARAIEARLTQHAMLDVMKIGGVTGWRAAAGMALAASMPISSHLFIEVSAHVMAATPNAYLIEFIDVASAVLETPYEVADGGLTPRGPGFGMEWNEAAVTRYAA